MTWNIGYWVLGTGIIGNQRNFHIIGFFFDQTGRFLPAAGLIPNPDEAGILISNTSSLEFDSLEV
jgi:hypothetical protein